MSQLLNDANNGNAKFFLQFGGQGAPWLKELSQYKQNPEFNKFFETVFNGFIEVHPHIKDSVAYNTSLDFPKWVEDPTTAPDDLILSSAGISLFAITVTQFAHYENLQIKGFDRSQMLKNSLGATGHSQGLIAASFAALQLEGEEYYTALKKYVQYMLYMGARAQEAFPYLQATNTDVTASETLASKDPAPMVAVLGESHSIIEKIVADVNETLDDNKKIYVSLYNTPDNRILSSFRSSLIKFNEKVKPLIEEKKLKFVYLRSSCPFHSKLMQPICEPFEKDIETLGFNYKGSDLKMPVYSFTDGRDIRSDEYIGISMYKDLMIENLYWDKSMQAVVNEKNVTHILDFGPGKTSQRLSQAALKALDSQLPVLAVATPKDLKAVLS